MSDRSTSLGFAVFMLMSASPLLSGCAGSRASDTIQRGVALAPARAASAFTAVSVERLADREDYRIAWQAPGARRVNIYLDADPATGANGAPIASGGGTGSMIAAGVGAGQRSYFTLVPDRGAPLVIADRGLHLPSAANLRDIGGYRTTDGRWVRMGMIYRSDQLDRLNDADVHRLDALGLGLVVDLRTQSERSREPDRLPAGAQPLVLDVAADSSGSLGGDMRKAQAEIAAGRGAEMLVAANRDFVSLPSARAAYGNLMQRLARGGGDDGAVLYHCTAGKDRTGWATAVILTLLGVPRETVMADYLLSNPYLREKNTATLAALKASGAPIDPAALVPVLTVRPEYLQSAFDEVTRVYGSFDAYAREGLGLTAADIEALQRRYLTESPPA